MYLSLVVPVYNEEKNILPLVSRLRNEIHDLECKYEIIFVLDPCKDNTEKVVLHLREDDRNIKLIKMSRRFGQPACTMAGINYCSGDVCVIIDADLQVPPELISEMVVKWEEGYDVVYAQRSSRKGETLLKRIVAWAGYLLMDRISEIKIPRNTGDFRLISREVMEHLKKLHEHDPYLRGLVSYVGFNQTAIQYNRDARLHGKGNYNRLLGSIRIALNGILGFSKYPLHLISVFGFIISALSIGIGLVYIVLKLIGYNIIWGNPTLVILISLLSGIQLLSLGIIAQYLGRIYDEIKGRPAYIVQEAVGFRVR